MFVKPLIATVLGAALLTFTGCGYKETVAGGGVQTGNTDGVFGIVYDVDNRAASGVIVTLVPQDFNPARDEALSAAYTDTTDEEGRYHIPAKIGSGPYNLQAEAVSSNSGLLVTGVEPDSGNAPSRKDTLKQSGSVVVDLPAGGAGSGGDVYVPGTLISVSLAEGDTVALLEDLPQGVALDLVWQPADAAETVVLAEEVSILPGDTVFIGPYSSWDFTAPVSFNLQGLDLTETLYDFPLLLRITEANAPSPGFFTDAGDRGASLRFSGPGGMHKMDFEIESWDVDGKQAEVWIHIDTLDAGEDLHSFLMYWGNARAASQSDGAAVFAESADFEAVWHMNVESSGPLAGQLTDVTGRGIHLQPGGGIEDGDPVAGPIGKAVHFDGVDDYFAGDTLDVLISAAGATLTTWVRPDTLDTDSLDQDFLDVAQSGVKKLARSRAEFGIMGDKPIVWSCAAIDSGRIGHHAAAGNLATGSWFQVTAIFDYANDSVAVYVNGTMVSSQTAFGLSSLSSSLPAERVSVGAEELLTVDFLRGALDELRVSRTLRSADWIKLSYETQKPSSTLITIGK